MQLQKSRRFPGGLNIVMSQAGPEHAKVFTGQIPVTMPGGGGEVLALGSASTKKEAERLCLVDAVRLIS